MTNNLHHVIVKDMQSHFIKNATNLFSFSGGNTILGGGTAIKIKGNQWTDLKNIDMI